MSQLTITWYDTPSSTDEARERIARLITEVPLSRRARRRRSYTAARKRMERRGHARLTAPTPDPHPWEPHVVRIYYRSMGGDLLCCESVHGRSEAYALRARYDATCWPVGDENPPAMRPGTRLIVFPSQMEPRADEQELQAAA